MMGFPLDETYYRPRPKPNPKPTTPTEQEPTNDQ